MAGQTKDDPESQAWFRHNGFSECGILCGINGGVGEVFFCKGLQKGVEFSSPSSREY